MRSALIDSEALPNSLTAGQGSTPGDSRVHPGQNAGPLVACSFALSPPFGPGQLLAESDEDDRRAVGPETLGDAGCSRLPGEQPGQRGVGRAVRGPGRRRTAIGQAHNEQVVV